jgi:hypothetical protein
MAKVKNRFFIHRDKRGCIKSSKAWGLTLKIIIPTKEKSSACILETEKKCYKRDVDSIAKTAWLSSLLERD